MSDTSGQDSSGGGGNGVFSNPTFQKLLQKTIGLVAQLHGGQDPNAAQAGAPTGAQQPGAGAPPQGGPAAALQQAPQPGMPQGPQQGPTSHNGMTLDQAPWSQRSQLPPQGGGSGGGQGSAPPSGATGQTLGAPQMPQQGYGGWGQPAAPPMQQGNGTQGSVTNIQPQQNFSQAPWMAGPLNDYAAFSKANPPPKQPTYEDAAYEAEKMITQKGFAPVGSNTNSLDYTPFIPGIMSSMNEQYKAQMEAHNAAWTGQIQAGHAHNQAMALAETARHNQADEGNARAAIVGKGTAAAANTAQHATAADQKHNDFKEHLAVLQQKADTALEAVRNAEAGKSRDQAIKIWQEAQKTARSFEADYVNALGPNSADTPEGKAELDRLHKGGDAAGSKPPPGGAGDKQYPTPDASHIKMLKDGTGTPAQFEEAFGPGSAAKYK